MTSTATGLDVREKIRSIFSFHLVVAASLILVVYLVGGGGVADPDIWWHLSNAQHFFSAGRLPQFDTFSFTVAGRPWIDHEWLGEVAYYLAWKALGLRGVYVLFLWLVGVILMGLFYLCLRTSGILIGSFLACFVAIMLMAVSFGPRTILFGYLDLTILLVLLRRFESGLTPRLWVLPLLFCLWINTHGSWLLGLIVFGMVGASGLVEGQWGLVEAKRWSPEQLRRLIAAGAASVGALFINPYGVHLVFYPFDLAYRQKLNIANIEEWASVDFHVGRGKIILALVLGILLGALIDRRRWKLHEVLLTGFGLYCGLTYVRFLFLAALLVAPLLARFLDFLPPYRPEIDKPALNAAFLVAILAIVVWRFPSEQRLEVDVNDHYPAAALKYAQARGLPANVFNFYSWGGFIAWKFPEFKTFVDSRTDIFEYAGVFRDYLDIWRLKDSYRLMEKYKIRSVLLPPDSPLCYVLEHQPDWKVAYHDKVSMLIEKAGPAPAQAAGGNTTGKTPAP